MPWSLIQIALLISAESSKYVLSYEVRQHQEKSGWRIFLGAKQSMEKSSPTFSQRLTQRRGDYFADNSFDLVLSSLAIHNIPKREDRYKSWTKPYAFSNR